MLCSQKPAFCEGAEAGETGVVASGGGHLVFVHRHGTWGDGRRGWFALVLPLHNFGRRLWAGVLPPSGVLVGCWGCGGLGYMYKQLSIPCVRGRW